jgi:ribosome-associated protein
MERPSHIFVTRTISLPEEELQFRFVRASGPGGQNVNKVSSAVELRFDAGHSPSLPAAVRVRLLALAGRRATNEGIIVIDAQRHRTQERNRADAIERLIDLVRQATVVPRVRRPTRPTRGSQERRIAGKKKRAEHKSGRGRAQHDD